MQQCRESGTYFESRCVLVRLNRGRIKQEVPGSARFFKSGGQAGDDLHCHCEMVMISRRRGELGMRG